MSPHYGKFIAYYRVSTDRQGKSGLGLDAQRKAVEDYLNGGRWTLVDHFTEVESGKRNDRPELEKALAACKKHKAKLVIAKLDRLARNVHFISGLMDAGVELQYEAAEPAPLFKADSATLSFYATKDGKISVSYQGWDQSKTVLAGQRLWSRGARGR